ncbi:uncharacterized protein [Eurosta solidaginis]|uniref:uncharacterized protein n=1 Tax=Eurosta solidaginis TaxID=178769 RepID=UPI00353110A1
MTIFANQRKCLNYCLDSLPVMESHYCRAATQKKYILPEWNSKRMIFHFYVKDWCPKHGIKPLSISVFYEAFAEYNYGLFSPKKDQCEICVRHSMDNISHDEYAVHQENKETRNEKQKEKAEERIVLTVDLHAVLMAPKSEVSSLYHRTKLQVHNLVFYNLINHKGYCFIWNEVEGGVSAEEFASIWVYFVEQKILPYLIET